MHDDAPSRLPKPPHNPGLRDLVAGKREWSPRNLHDDAKRGFRGWHERGYLPHRDEPGLTQFVTFRLADSFPVERRSEWGALLAIEEQRERRTQLEAYLDKGRGECLLHQSTLAKIVEDALRFFHGQRYQLHAWVVMPNHVHALFKVGETPMSEIVKSWKGFTAHEINNALTRQGQLWADDYWDTYMRGIEQERRSIRYIESNPLKAFLVRSPGDWVWSSARMRDEAGVLHI